MSSVIIDLFCEDEAHEEFVKAMVTRLAREEGRAIRINVRSARGGHGRVMRELETYLKAQRHRIVAPPDILVTAVDANCKPWTQVREEIEGKVRNALGARPIMACPDPRVERWYVADPPSFHQVVGRRPQMPARRKCERGLYKKVLRDAICAAGHVLTQGGREFAEELVADMDVYRAGRDNPSLKDFTDAMRNALRTVERRTEGA